MAILAADFLQTSLSILWVALGLGLVIFFHELGHFVVAKWCGVFVERFSIGFGPILWSWKKGGTEYAFSAIPFGGYVKMLGQDDVDPSQLSSEEIAEDQRSYSAKPVSQRMAIISAGVLMNVITGLAFFAVAFRMGVETSPSVVGAVQVGMPAWKAGLQPGDRITRINGREIISFGDIMRGVALSTGPVTVKGVSDDGREFNKTLTPDDKGSRRLIGVNPTLGLRLIDPDNSEISPVVAGTPAGRADPPFERGDIIRKIGETSVTTFPQLQQILAEKRGETLDFHVERKEQTKDNLVKISVGPSRFRTLGLWMAIGQIAAVQENSPASRTDPPLEPGDKITEVNKEVIGEDINPLELPDYFAKLHGQEIEIVVKRQVPGADPQKLRVRLVPENKPGWVERPLGPNVPLSVPAAGFAFHLIPSVRHVEPGSPADKAGIKGNTGESIKKMELILPEEIEPEGNAKRIIPIEFGPDENNWAYAFWMMQRAPRHKVRLTVSKGSEVRRVELQPRLKEDWFVPTRGIHLAGLPTKLEADGVAEAIQMGITHTSNSIVDIYLTLRNLFGGLLSVKELHGPIGIATVAYEVARHGLADLLVFLGFLSVNLAVLNFLPIPVLDGGHMVFLCWEGITRRKPSERVLVAATYFGMAFVLGLMLFVLYLDIFVHRLSVN